MIKSPCGISRLWLPSKWKCEIKGCKVHNLLCNKGPLNCDSYLKTFIIILLILLEVYYLTVACTFSLEVSSHSKL